MASYFDYLPGRSAAGPSSLAALMRAAAGDRYEEPKPNPSLLQRLASGLDWPRRALWSAILGKKDASGEDLLRALGVRKPHGLASFATEVVTDPLTYLGGVGALTKAGKGAKGLAALRRQAGTLLKLKRAAPAGAATEKYGELLKRLQGLYKPRRAALTQTGAATRFAPTWASQARQAVPQRRLLGWDIPFGPKGTLAVGAPVLSGMAALGRASGAGRVAGGLSRAFRTPAQRMPEIQEALHTGRHAGAEAAERSVAKEAEIRAALKPLIEESGLQRGEYLDRFANLRESLSVPGRKAAEIGRIKSTRDEMLEKILEADKAARREPFRQGVKTLEGDARRADAILRKQIERHGPRGPGVPDVRRRVERLKQMGGRRLGRYLEGPPTPATRRKLAAAEKKAGRMIKERLEDAATAEKAIAQLPRASQDYARKLFRETEEVWEAQVKSGARSPNARLQSLTKDYMERVLTPEAVEYLRKNPGARSRFYKHLDDRLRIKEGSQVKRVGKFREEFTTAANEALRKEKDIGFDWFQIDPSKSFPAKYLSKELSQINAGVFESLAAQFSRRVGEGDIPLSDFLSKAPLYKYAGQAIGSTPEVIERQLAAVGKGGLGVPAEVAEAALDLSGRLGRVEEVAPLLKVYDKYLGIMRFSLTAPWPAFHVRNSLTNVVMNWLGGVSNPKYYAQALKHLTDPKLAIELKKRGVLRGGQIDDVIRELGGRTARGEDVQTTWGKIVRRTGKVSEATENFGRAAHYLAKLDEGKSSLEALQSVNKYLFDYGDITKLEKQVGKRTIMFYQWARKILPRLLGEYVQNPRKMALLTRASGRPSSEREALPSYLRRTLAIPMGKEGGSQRYITGLGLPTEEISKYDVTSSPGVFGGARSLGQSLMGMTASPIKGAAELVSGRDFFLDRPLLEADRASTALRGLPEWAQKLISFKEETAPSGHKSYRADPLSLWALKQTPLSRLLMTAGKAADPRKGVGEKLANILTGVKTSTVDPNFSELEAAKMSLEEKLARAVREGTAGRFRGFYARRGDLDEKDPEVVALLKALRALGKRRKELAQAQR